MAASSGRLEWDAEFVSSNDEILQAHAGPTVTDSAAENDVDSSHDER